MNDEAVRAVLEAAPCGCDLLGRLDEAPPLARDAMKAAAAAYQARWGCDRGPAPGAPDEQCTVVARGIERLLQVPEGSMPGCPKRRLFDPDVGRACRYRRFLHEPGGAAALDKFEPDPPAILLDAVDAILEGEGIAHRLWKERFEREDAERKRRAADPADVGPGRVRRRG